MTILDRIKIGWDVLLQLEPEIRTRFAAAEAEQHRVLGEPANTSILAQPPLLKDLIADVGVLPPYSIIIGACPDRSHIFLDLTDPRPGSLLIIGDAQTGKTRLLNTILRSAALLNSPRRMHYAILSEDVAPYGDLPVRPHCQQIKLPESEEATSLVFELADLVEQRQKNGNRGEAILLAIDDLAEFLNHQDEDTANQLRWLIHAGPEQWVWTLAALRSEDVESLDYELLLTFGTRLFGRIETPEICEELIGTHAEHLAALESGKQFGLFYGEEWVSFWVPGI